jgi:hypothetical protein
MHYWRSVQNNLENIKDKIINAFVQIYNYIWQISVSLPIKVQLMFRANICLVENRKQSILAATYKSSLRLEWSLQCSSSKTAQRNKFRCLRNIRSKVLYNSYRLKTLNNLALKVPIIDYVLIEILTYSCAVRSARPTAYLACYRTVSKKCVPGVATECSIITESCPSARSDFTVHKNISATI